MIIFDNVAIHAPDGRTYKLSFHIPTPSITVIITPALFDKVLLANYILGYKKPLEGNIVSKLEIQGLKGLFIPELASGRSIVLNEILNVNKEGTLYSEICNLLKQFGFKADDNPIVLEELPTPLLYLISVLYVLKNSGNLAVLIEPFKELDDELISRQIIEIYEKRRKNSTIVIVSSNRNLVDQIDYDHLIIIKHSGAIYETSTKIITLKNILRDTITFEIILGKENLAELASLKCLKGILSLGKDRFYVFVRKAMYRICLSYLNDLWRKGVIKSIKIVKQDGMEEWVLGS